MRRSPSAPSRRRRTPAALLPACAALALTLAGHAPAQTGPQSPPPPPTSPLSTEDSDALLAVLADARADRARRDSAADRLVAAAADPAVSRMLADILGRDAERSGARGVLVNAIARASEPPEGLFRPLTQLVARTQPGRRSPALAALGSFRTYDAALALFESTDPGAPPADRAAAFRALVRMTGKEELGDDRDAWKVWLDASRGLSPGEWRASLAPSLARHSDRLRNDRDAAVERLIDASRRLYLLTPEDARDAYLAALLLDDFSEVRALGFEIVSRELSAGSRAFGNAVADAAIALLASPDPAVRADAAALVNQLAPPAGGPAIAQALLRETDPRAAASLLLAAARWPDGRLVPVVLDWVARDTPARPGAFAALFALHRAGIVASDEDRSAALIALRATSPADLSVTAIRLLLAVGEESDRRAVAGLLNDTSQGVRFLAAEALLDRPEFVDDILRAARSDPALFDLAARAVAAHRPTAAGLAELRTIPAPTPDAQRAGIIRTAAALPLPELLAAARAITDDADLREQILSRITNPPAQGTPAADHSPEAAEALILLAQTRLALGRPEGALAALSLLPKDRPGPDSRDARCARAAALLWLNRLDQATETGAPASAWIDGLEMAIHEPHAAAIARTIQVRFGSELTPDEEVRLAQLAGRIEQPPPPGNGGPPR